MSASVESIILAVVQFAWPFLIGKFPQLESVPKKLVPALNFVLALVVKLVGPDPANAGLFGISGKGLLQAVLEAAAQTLLVTGVHSSGKNFLEQLLGVGLKKIK
jgi:hypothetical protein